VVNISHIFRTLLLNINLKQVVTILKQSLFNFYKGVCLIQILLYINMTCIFQGITRTKCKNIILPLIVPLHTCLDGYIGMLSFCFSSFLCFVFHQMYDWKDFGHIFCSLDKWKEQELNVHCIYSTCIIYSTKYSQKN
jgi:hypothetical protein